MNAGSKLPRLGFLFLGTGWAARIHARTLRRHFPSVGLHFLGRSPDRTGALAQEVGGEAYPGDRAAALADPRIDAVVITTPPATHLRLALEALTAGKDVIVEKPAFLDVEECDLIEAAAARTGARVLVAENYHYKPLAARLREIVASGALGRIRIIEINAVKRQSISGWRLDPAQAGGGALFEGGIHWVSLLADLGLEVVEVEGAFPDAPPGDERSAVVTFRYAQGAVGILTYSWEIPSTLRGLRLSRIWGTGGSILFESNGLFGVRSDGVPRPFLPGLRDIAGYRAMMTDFVRSIATGAEPSFTLGHARRDIDLVRAAYASGQPSHLCQRGYK